MVARISTRVWALSDSISAAVITVVFSAVRESWRGSRPTTGSVACGCPSRARVSSCSSARTSGGRKQRRVRMNRIWNRVRACMLRLDSMIHAVLSIVTTAPSQKRGGDCYAETFHVGAGGGFLSINGWGKFCLLLFRIFAAKVAELNL